MQAGRYFLARRVQGFLPLRLPLPLCAALPLCALLAGCSAGKDIASLSCPETGFLRGAETITVHSPGAPSDMPWAERPVLTRAQIADFSGGCRFGEAGVETRVDITLVAATGSAGQKAGVNLARYPLFVSVLAPDDRVLVRERYEIEVEFPDGLAGQKKERISAEIPLSDVKVAGDYKLVFGFEVPEEQWQHTQKQRQAQ